MGRINKVKAFELSAGNVTVFGEFSEKLKNNKKAAALGTTPLALILSACGGGSSSTTSSNSSSTTSSNVLTLTKSADTYSASAVTGFTVADSSTAKFDVADASSNAYEIKLDATGTGVLEFDFVDAGDTVTLAAGSKTSGFTTLKVTDGTLDATNADLTGITRFEVASGIKISLAQIKEIPTIVANSAISEIIVEVTTEAEATELVSLISAGTVKVFADTNPIKLVAAPAATVATETLEKKQTETTASVKPTAEESPDTSATDTTTDTDTSTGTTGGGGGGSSTPGFDLSQTFNVIDPWVPAVFIVGTQNGNVTVIETGNNAIFLAATGHSIEKPTADVTSLIVNEITLTTTAKIADGKTITGDGAITLTALEGDAAADLSGITVTGTKTVNVADDVTFTGDLGSFAVTVDTGKILTTTAANAIGRTMTGAGGVTLTVLDADADADLSSITVSGMSGTKTVNVADDVTFTGDLGSFAVTVDTGKTLTTTAAIATGLTMTGGSVTITGDIAADANLTNITSTVDLDEADVAISASKTLTLTAAQADGEVFSGAGTLSVSASSDDQSFTATTSTLSIDAGAGNDTIIVGDAGNITAADEINMGAGSADAIHIMADDDTTTGAVFDEAGHVGAETIKVLVSTTAATENAKVMLDYASAYDQDITIDASLLTNSSANFVLALDTAANVDGDLTVTGGAGNDSITTGDGADIIMGGDGADTISTDAGNDTVIVDADDSASVSSSTAGNATGSDHWNDWASGDLIRITGVLSDGFNASTDVVVGTGAEASVTDVIADAADFLATTYLVARDGDVTDGFDTAMIVTTDGSTAAFADAAAAQAATAFNVTLGDSGNTVVLGANADTIVGGSGDDIITGLGGADSINGGAGNDTFIITDADDDGTRESYVGGGGDADKIDINTTEAINLSNDTIATVEILDLDASGVVNLGVTVTAAQLSAFTTVTAAADDTIIVNTLTGQSVAGTAAIDKFDFASGDAGVTITDFSVATEVDVLDVAGLGTYALVNANTFITEITVAEATNESSPVTSIVDNKAALIEVDDITTADSVADMVTALGTAGVLDGISLSDTATDTSLLIIGDDDSGTTVYMYQYTSDGTAGVVADELMLVATITGSAGIIDSLAEANFAF